MKNTQARPESDTQKRKRATDAFAAMRADIARACIPEMTLDEINAVIKEVRDARHSRYPGASASEEPNAATLAAAQELKDGGGTRCDTIEDYLKAAPNPPVDSTLYPIGIHDLETIRKDGYIYVDKTLHIWRLVSTGRFYFLSRPRRFGKSLLLFTIEAYFSGRKELFEGLAIAGLEKDWITYPVLRFDFGDRSYRRPDDLDEALDAQLEGFEKKYGITDMTGTSTSRFRNLIETAFEITGRQVVVLIDEYDKPVLDSLGEETLSGAIRRQLEAFYSALKAENRYIRFGFLAGVTKIGLNSAFGGLNNLKDISMDASYADICGISIGELRKHFDVSVAKLAGANGISVDECYRQLARMYGGYHFCEDVEGMFNPFSILNALDAMEFKDYWIETGTPFFLKEVMRRTDFDLTEIAHAEADYSLLTNIDTVFWNPIPFLYQSGYLTITGYDADTGIYSLGFPNLEVKHGFLSYISNRCKSVSSLRTAIEVGEESGYVEGFDFESHLAELQNRKHVMFKNDNEDNP